MERKQTNMVRVWCMEESVSHVPVSDRHAPMILWKRNPYENECYVDVKRKLLEAELRGSTGFRYMVENGTLKIKDQDIIRDFNLEDLGEYVKDKDDLREFVLTCTEDELEDYLQYAPDTMLLNIESIFTKTELNSRAKIKMIKSYTGVDLEEFYKDMDEEGVDVKSEVATKTKTGAKRQARKPVDDK